MKTLIPKIKYFIFLFTILFLTNCSGGSSIDLTTSSGDSTGGNGQSTTGGDTTGVGTGEGVDKYSLENCNQCLEVLKSKYFLPLTEGYIEIHDSVIDSEGNLIITGNFRKSNINLGGIDLFNFYTEVPNDLDQDIFIAKFSPTLEHLWSYRYGTNYSEWANALLIDAENNVYLAGYFAVEIKFGETVLTTNQHKAFITKLNGSDGVVVWAKAFNPVDALNFSLNHNRIKSLSYSSSQNKVLYAGYGSYIKAGSETASNIGFVGALNPENAEVYWNKVFETKTYFDPIVEDIDAEDAKLSVIGNFRKELVVDEQSYLTSSRAIFFAQLNINDGTLNFLKTFSSSIYISDYEILGELNLRIAQSPSGEIYIGGQFIDPIELDDLLLPPVASDNQIDLFLIKLDSTGKALWGKALGKPLAEKLSELKITSDQKVYLTGALNTQIEEKPGDPTSFLTPFLASFQSSDGKELYLKEMLSLGNGKTLAFRADGNFFWAGEYWDAIDFLDVSLPDANFNGIFIFEMKPNL